MSDEEKKGYLKALGIDPWDSKSAPTENDADDDYITISVDRSEFSGKELSLLQKGSTRVWGA